MTKDQYDIEIKSLLMEFEKRKRDLQTKYAISNNPYKVGDVIVDHMGAIKIESIRTYGSFATQYPACIYSGLELRKDHTPKKSGIKREVYQTNIQ